MTNIGTRVRMEEASIQSALSRVLSGPGIGVFGIPVWKLILLQDILVLGAFGVGMMLFPAQVVALQAKVAGYAGWPPAAWLVKSDTFNVLLAAIGCIATGFCIHLFQALLTDDTAFAGALALFHLFNAITLGYCASYGGVTHTVLIPFAAHNLVGGAGLMLTTPGIWDKLLSKVHIA